MAVAVPLAVGAAACFATSNVLQARAVRSRLASGRVDMRIVGRLATQKLWLAGLAISVVGFFLQAVALAIAPVVLVQPLVVAELLFALPLAAFANGSRLGQREWTGAILVTAGLVLFVSIIRPTNPRFDTGPGTWLGLSAGSAVAVAALVASSSRVRGVARTSMLAAAAGISLGLMSVLTKAAAHEFTHHGLAALATWKPWSVALAGLVGLSLVQNTFGAGPLAVSLPLMDIGEPLVASVVAIAVFGESLGRLTPVGVAGLLAAAAVVMAGVVVLDRSPAVQAVQSELSAGADSVGPEHCEVDLVHR